MGADLVEMDSLNANLARRRQRYAATRPDYSIPHVNNPFSD